MHDFIYNDFIIYKKIKHMRAHKRLNCYVWLLMKKNLFRLNKKPAYNYLFIKFY